MRKKVFQMQVVGYHHENVQRKLGNLIDMLNTFSFSVATGWHSLSQEARKAWYLENPWSAIICNPLGNTGRRM